MWCNGINIRRSRYLLRFLALSWRLRQLDGGPRRINQRLDFDSRRVLVDLTNLANDFLSELHALAAVQHALRLGPIEKRASGIARTSQDRMLFEVLLCLHAVEYVQHRSSLINYHLLSSVRDSARDPRQKRQQW